MSYAEVMLPVNRRLRMCRILRERFNIALIAGDFLYIRTIYRATYLYALFRAPAPHDLSIIKGLLGRARASPAPTVARTSGSWVWASVYGTAGRPD